jgi:hypothetical protein
VSGEMVPIPFDDLVNVKSYSEIRSDLAEAEAKERGCVVVKPKANELFVDIDDDFMLEHFNRNIEVLRRSHKIRVRRTPSPSGEPAHFHIVVTLDRDVQPMERILLQSCLGSDPMREILSWQRLQCGDECPTLFFEKAEAAQ